MLTRSLSPLRGEVWMLDFDPTRGHEQAGRRPALVLSVDVFNRGPASLVVVCPITSRNRNIEFHIDVVPPEGGLTVKSYIMAEHVRSVSKDRLALQMGSVSSLTLARVENRLRALLKL